MHWHLFECFDIVSCMYFCPSWIKWDVDIQSELRKSNINPVPKWRIQFRFLIAQFFGALTAFQLSSCIEIFMSREKKIDSMVWNKNWYLLHWLYDAGEELLIYKVAENQEKRLFITLDIAKAPQYVFFGGNLTEHNMI